MNQTIAAQQHVQSRSLSIGDLEAPKIDLLGSLDDEQGTKDLAYRQAPLDAIIYNGI